MQNLIKKILMFKKSLECPEFNNINLDSIFTQPKKYLNTKDINKQSFYFYNIKNYIISKNNLELLTGEIFYKGNKYKYVILNDPDDKWIESASLLTSFDLESPELKEKCKKRYKEIRDNCNNLDSIKISVVNHNLLFYKELFCNCKNIRN